MKLRSDATAKFDTAITSTVARPRLTAFTTLVLTARMGHRPSSCTRPVFCRHRPFHAVSRKLCRFIACCPSQSSARRGCEQGVAVAQRVVEGAGRRVQHRARADGCARTVCEYAAVALDLPFAGAELDERDACELPD